MSGLLPVAGTTGFEPAPHPRQTPPGPAGGRASGEFGGQQVDGADVGGDREHGGSDLHQRGGDLPVEVRGAPLLTQVASACAGTFLFAEAGILDGLRATTSWWLSPLFRSRYPQVTLDQSRMVTSCDGVTTAGAAFGHVDLALSIVRRSSPALSDLVGNYLVIDERPSQAAHTMTGTLAASDPTVAAFERWAREHLHEPISVSDAADAVGVSERTLQRATRAVLGTSPVRFVQDLRIEQATHLLRSTDHSIEAIARRVGYENANTLRILLRERTGTTTGQHRRRHSEP